MVLLQIFYRVKLQDWGIMARKFTVGFVDISPISYKDFECEKVNRVDYLTIGIDPLTETQIKILIGSFLPDMVSSKFGEIIFTTPMDENEREQKKAPYIDLFQRGYITQPQLGTGPRGGEYICLLTDKGQNVVDRIIEYKSRPRYQRIFFRFVGLLNRYSWFPGFITAVIGGIVTGVVIPIVRNMLGI